MQSCRLLVVASQPGLFIAIVYQEMNFMTFSAHRRRMGRVTPANHKIGKMLRRSFPQCEHKVTKHGFLGMGAKEGSRIEMVLDSAH